MTVVVALGGNALLRRGAPMTLTNQVGPVREACRAIAPVAKRHPVVVTHGNGPQVGLLALETSDAGPDLAEPFDVLGAMTEGMIGYLIERELRSALGAGSAVATFVTLAVVDADDPAFGHPDKFVGPGYDETDARKLADARGWAVARDADQWRRVVPSPRPREILVADAVRRLVDAGTSVICAGGGGVPTVRGPDHTLTGVEAVIDKDLASAVLAHDLEADRLVMATDVEGVFAGWGTPAQRRISRVHPDALDLSVFAAGSMRPKVEAAIQVARDGHDAVIGSLDQLEGLISDRAGTVVSTRFDGIAYA